MGDELAHQKQQLWRTGRHVLPGAADQLNIAYVNNPTYSSYVFGRTGPVGVDLGPQWEQLAELLDRSLQRNEDAVRDIAVWMLGYITDMSATDQYSKARFDRLKKELA